ncbi:MAG: UDP-N-acetylmuramate dehydrogenase [Candidatus Sumerlaeaceae bacterium]|nr:UDP-N-acetylmuramate dehydrogenase [Candidatus Sumerlaeaceae bacterium]
MSQNKPPLPLHERMVCNHPLAHHTTIGVGGAARYFLQAQALEDVRYALAWARERELPLFVLGGGSNVVVADSGFPGLVLQLATRGWRVEQRDAETVVMHVASGERWDYVVEHAVAQGWAGIECLSGIPGQVGATPIQNVGAYGQQVSETIVEVKALDLATGQIETFPSDSCEFGYRTSRFKTRDAGRYLIIEVAYRLFRDAVPSVRYAELAAYLDEQKIRVPTLAQVRGAVRAIRARKSMLADPNDPNARSCGSFFVNPVVSREKFEEIVNYCRRKALIGSDEMPPHYAAGDDVKLSAAWLIEHAGLKRGTRLGAAALSQKHALAIVNLGGAKARDIIALAQLVRTQVFERFGVVLQPEPVFVGFESPPLSD